MLYSFIQYFFATPTHPGDLKEISTEELISDIQLAEQKEQSDDEDNSDYTSRFQSVILFFTPKKKTRVEDVFNGEGFEEEIEMSVEEDGFDILDEEVIEEELIEDEEKQSEEILMTEQKAKEIDNLTRSTIQREEFDAELQYLKKK